MYQDTEQWLEKILFYLKKIYVHLVFLKFVNGIQDFKGILRYIT